MPVADARSPLSLTARVALPSRVRWSTSATVTSTIADSTVMVKSRGVTATGPRSQAIWLL